MATCHRKTESVGTGTPLRAVGMHVTCFALMQACNGCPIRSSALYSSHIQGHVLTGFQCAPRTWKPGSTVEPFKKGKQRVFEAH